jgi:hypothetical protein
LLQVKRQHGVDRAETGRSSASRKPSPRADAADSAAAVVVDLVLFKKGVCGADGAGQLAFSFNGQPMISRGQRVHQAAQLFGH